jgi:hypothetical protein
MHLWSYQLLLQMFDVAVIGNLCPYTTGLIFGYRKQIVPIAPFPQKVHDGSKMARERPMRYPFGRIVLWLSPHVQRSSMSMAHYGIAKHWTPFGINEPKQAATDRCTQDASSTSNTTVWQPDAFLLGRRPNKDGSVHGTAEKNGRFLSIQMP